MSGGATMSEVSFRMSNDYKFSYFTCLLDKEVNKGEQNHQNQKLSTDFHMDLNFLFLFLCPK